MPRSICRSATAALTFAALVAGATACKYDYPGDVEDAAVFDEDGLPGCMPNLTTCADDTLTVCDAAGHATQTACPFGCFTDGTRCADLAPSNGLAPYLDQSRTAQPISLTDPVIIDTDSGTLMDVSTGQNIPITSTVMASQPVDLFVLVTSSFEAKKVDVVGSRALAIVSDGDVRLHGVLSVDARGTLAGFVPAGPGAGSLPASTASCTARMGAFDAGSHGGAGGGAFGTTGGRGGQANGLMGGKGGDVTGNELLIPLRGGCAGQPGWIEGAVTAPAGAAGGAIEIATRRSIMLDADGGISANGGSVGFNVHGCPFAATDPAACNAGSGGGAGGGILLEAAALDVAANAAIVANGSTGSCSYGGPSGAGLLSESPAEGPDCSLINGVDMGAGTGGSGGAGTFAAGDGGDAMVSGGGGGGGAGRIRINLPAGVTFDPGPPIVSPAPSLGVARTR
ncbi:MAG TPA: hypothetical protein VHE35_00795 [Kofleriaceae bacterium]|nr:hypothetical protein [Kofleriaceae bacterium]